jgi:cell division protease FtsH
MSPAIGPVTVGEKPGEVFIGRDLTNMGNVAAKTLELVDAETRRMVREAEETAKQVIELNAVLLEDLANTLLQAETLSGPALEVFLSGVKPWTEVLLVEKTGDQPVRMKVASDGSGESTGEPSWPEAPEVE